MVTRASRAHISALKADLARRKELKEELEKYSLANLARQYFMSIRQVVRINKGEQRGGVK